MFQMTPGSSRITDVPYLPQCAIFIKAQCSILHPTMPRFSDWRSRAVGRGRGIFMGV